MKVELISPTSNPEAIVAAAAKICYSSKDATQLMENLTPENIQKFISRLADMGHQSPFEHVCYTFSISGVSRTLLAQITRHRIASYSVRSQRYVDESNFEYIIPDSIANIPKANQIYIDAMENIRKSYNEIKDILYQDSIDVDDSDSDKKAKIKLAQEDARYVLPNATETKMVVTMNARSLLNFFQLRCCQRAQTEIRTLAYEMLRLCYEMSPNLFRYAGPSCYHGTCKEGGMSCGRVDEVRRKGDSIRGIGC